MGYYPAGGGVGACYVHLDGQNRPVAVVGSITIHDTNDRDNPPAPICGLDCDYSPLGRGHVMALQLGGPDVAENIVPQYQQWQQTGAWRGMERQAMMHASGGNFVFAAVMTYGNTGDADAGNYWKEFEENPTFFWDDTRIPTRFQVWILDASVNPGARLVTEILAPTAAARGTAAAQLAATLATTPVFREFTVVGHMPAEDLAFWRTMELGNSVSAAYDDYTTAHQEGAAVPEYMMSPRRPTEAEFVQEYGDVVREVLVGNGWSDHEINQHASNTHMFQAVYHEKPLRKGTVKKLEERMKKHLKVKNDWSKQSKPQHESRRKAAKAMLKRKIQGTNVTTS
jgi:hypothetical protein